MANPSVKRVVVLGGGPGGAFVAKNLDAKGVAVTLIEPRDFVFLKLAALRAAVRGGAWTERAMIPLSEETLFGKAKGKSKQSAIVKQRAVSVDDVNKTVTLADGTTVKWDVLVCATGSRSKSLAEPPPATTVEAASASNMRAWLSMTRAVLASAKSAVVVGGGPVGVELAGELRVFAPHVKVTVVTGKTGLLGSNVPPLPATYIDSVKKLMASQAIDVVDGATVTLPAWDPNAAFVMPPNGQVALDNGKTLQADVVFFAMGVDVASGIYPPAWLDASRPTVRDLAVEPNLLVKGTTNVFALGDVASTGAGKFVYLAELQAGIVANNVRVLLAGKPISKMSMFKPMSSAMILVPLGPKLGRTQTPMGIFGDKVSSLLKGKGLFAQKFWKSIVGGKATPPTPSKEEFGP